MELATCPSCGAEYPTFCSPPGQLGTYCDSCGYTSPDYLAPGRAVPFIVNHNDLDTEDAPPL